MIDRFFLVSSNLLGGEYDDETQTLTVEFRDGRTYEGRVPQGIAEGLKKSQSPGTYYYRQIRFRYPMVET